jgi:MerR family redox-sensitive transcriptional activator SoxR
MGERERMVTIGELSQRTGVATSALRFYDDKGLIDSARTEGNQRRYRWSTARTVSVIRAAQSVGLSLDEIGEALDALPEGRTPNKKDWQHLSRGWRKRLDEQIAGLERLRDDLSDCIGCGCLSLTSCALYNSEDRAGRYGTGARYLAGDFRGRAAG